jgi:CHAT domain-containing protein
MRILPNTYQLLANVYANLENYNEADRYFNKAIETTLIYRGDESYYIADQYNAYGKFLLRIDDLFKAEKYLLDANRILKQESSKSFLTYQNNNLYLSELHQKNANYDKGLEYALIAYNNRSNIHNSYSLSSIEQLFSVYKDLGEIDSCKILLSELRNISGFGITENELPEKDPNLLKNPWVTYNGFLSYLKLESSIDDNQDKLYDKVKYGISLIDTLREEYFYEASEKSLQSNLREFYDWSIDRLGNQYKITSDPKYLRLLSECMERSKSLLLEREIIKEAMLLNKGIPKDIIKEEERIIYSYEKNYAKFISQSESSDSLKSLTQSKLYQLQKRRESFIDSMRINYPEYYSKRYSHSVFSLEECQRIISNENRTCIIYHWSDSIIHRLIINEYNIQYEQVAISDVESNLIRLEEIVMTPVSEIPEGEFDRGKSEFVALTTQLYKSLIGEYSTINNSLTIIPDNRLVHLPFEILLDTEVDSNLSYRYLPYLLRNVEINYCGSMNQVNSQSDHSGYECEREYVGFAPSYDYVDNADYLDMSETRADMSMSQLLYNKSEILKSNELFDGECFIDEFATEQLFKSKAPHTSILHLAMHTNVASNQPYESYLQFKPVMREEENGKLHLDEIAKLRLNSNLVVLGACQTNVGENISGESILGIARAFQLASCKNILLTNWIIDDRSSSQIIPTFLNGIKNGLTPPKALQDSKIKYLSRCSEINTHPYYWSAYCYYGAPQVITSKSNWFNYFIVGIVALIGFRFFYRRFLTH